MGTGGSGAAGRFLEHGPSVAAGCNCDTSPVPMATIDSPFEPDLTERSTPLAPAVQDVCSSTARLNRRSERLGGLCLLVHNLPGV